MPPKKKADKRSQKSSTTTVQEKEEAKNSKESSKPKRNTRKAASKSQKIIELEEDAAILKSDSNKRGTKPVSVESRSSKPIQKKREKIKVRSNTDFTEFFMADPVKEKELESSVSDDEYSSTKLSVDSRRTHSSSKNSPKDNGSSRAKSPEGKLYDDESLPELADIEPTNSQRKSMFSSVATTGRPKTAQKSDTASSSTKQNEKKSSRSKSSKSKETRSKKPAKTAIATNNVSKDNSKSSGNNKNTQKSSEPTNRQNRNNTSHQNGGTAEVPDGSSRSRQTKIPSSGPNPFHKSSNIQNETTNTSSENQHKLHSSIQSSSSDSHTPNSVNPFTVPLKSNNPFRKNVPIEVNPPSTPNNIPSDYQMHFLDKNRYEMQQQSSDATIITVPLQSAETPAIRRNKEMRRRVDEKYSLASNGSSSSRRSSLANRGKRTSSIGNGFKAVPHPDVKPEVFHKHLNTDAPEPHRMRQLLIWSFRRLLEQQEEAYSRLKVDPNLSTEDKTALRIARLIQEELANDLSEGRIDTSWWNKDWDKLKKIRQGEAEEEKEKYDDNDNDDKNQNNEEEEEEKRKKKEAEEREKRTRQITNIQKVHKPNPQNVQNQKNYDEYLVKYKELVKEKLEWEHHFEELEDQNEKLKLAMHRINKDMIVRYSELLQNGCNENDNSEVRLALSDHSSAQLDLEKQTITEFPLIKNSLVATTLSAEKLVEKAESSVRVYENEIDRLKNFNLEINAAINQISEYKREVDKKVSRAIKDSQSYRHFWLGKRKRSENEGDDYDDDDNDNDSNDDYSSDDDNDDDDDDDDDEIILDDELIEERPPSKKPKHVLDILLEKKNQFATTILSSLQNEIINQSTDTQEENKNNDNNKDEEDMELKTITNSIKSFNPNPKDILRAFTRVSSKDKAKSKANRNSILPSN